MSWSEHAFMTIYEVKLTELGFWAVLWFLPNFIINQLLFHLLTLGKAKDVDL